MLKERPPARFEVIPPYQPMPTTRRTALHLRRSWRGVEIDYDDTMRVQVVLEQPRLVLNSAAQPFVRWGHRRTARTHMRATPAFQGRWAFVGALINRYLERQRMAGVGTRTAGGGYSFYYPQWNQTPRVVGLSNPSQRR